MTEPTTSPETTPKLGEVNLRGPTWSWPQFGLRTMLLLVLLLAMPLGWTAWRVIAVRRQQEVLDRIAPFGGQAGWLSGNIVQLTFRGSQFQDAALAGLGRLPRLKRVVLIDTGVTAAGLAHLRGVPLTELKVLRASALGGDAMQSLGAMGALESLWLEETSVGDEALPSLAALRQLRSLSLIGNPISDHGLAALAPLQQLEEVYLQRTEVTEAGVEELRRELPKANVAF